MKTHIYALTFPLLIGLVGCANDSGQKIKSPLISYGGCGKPSIANAVVRDGNAVELVYNEKVSTPCQ